MTNIKMIEVSMANNANKNNDQSPKSKLNIRPKFLKSRPGGHFWARNPLMWPLDEMSIIA